MERDAEGKPYWVKTDEAMVLQGLVATWRNTQRICVVTVDTPQEFAHVQPRWPRVLCT